MAPEADLKVLAFDVFGTVVDWRGGVAAEMAAVAKATSDSLPSGRTRKLKVQLYNVGAWIASIAFRHSSRWPIVHPCWKG